MNRHLYGVIRFLIVLAITVIGSLKTIDIQAKENDDVPVVTIRTDSPAANALTKLPIKGRAAKTGYTRAQFSDGWDRIDNCDMRNFILSRDLANETFVMPTCKVATGTLFDPYTGTTMDFVRGLDTSDDIQIDHVVSLSDAWQKGAQQLAHEQRHAFANDPLNLLAVNGQSNQDKGDGDAATWLPPNKAFRCSYVARQIAVKTKYTLWITASEHDAMARILTECPKQTLPVN